MSPTEFDLRAALRDGEGDGVDPDRVISQGRARQAQRRTRIMSAAAVVGVVAAAAIGGAVLWNGDGARTSTADRGSAARAANGDALHADSAAGAGASAANGAASAPAAAKPTPGNRASAAAVPCPDSLPRQLLPGGGSPGQFGADGPMFGKQVASLVVCSYGTPLIASEPGLAIPARLVLTGSQAKVLVNSIEQADTKKGITGCPRLRNLDQRELAIIPIAADGSTLPTLTTTLSNPACDVRVTNGTALRFNWKPPQDLQELLITLTPRKGHVSVSVPQVGSSGKNHGSPIQS